VSFKWPGIPSPHASEHELADFAELSAWQSDGNSATALSRLLDRLDENDHSDGVQEEEEIDIAVEAAYEEMEKRSEACGDGYPFEIGNHGHTLRARGEMRNSKRIIYKYSLLSTRLNMRDDRVHANIDGTLLFEELASEVARNYLGDRAKNFVFGTAAERQNFAAKINALCGRMGEGSGFVNRNEAPPRERDGKLDIVVWTPFTDGLPGKLIAFGQCKTGTNYKDTLTHLQPDSFCKKWLQSPLVFTPIRMFFISEALRRSRWHNDSVDAGLLFDRCRIVDFCDDISEGILEKVATWTSAAAKATGLPG
jgi:hypothetical protein